MRMPKCTEKERENARKYYWAHRAECLEYKKREREEQKEKITSRKKEYYEKNKELILINKKQYYKSNIAKIKTRKKEHYNQNTEKLLSGHRLWRERNAESIKERISRNRPIINEYERNRLRNNPKLRISRAMKCQIYYSLKKQKNGNKWEKLVGYTTEDLMNCLGKQFKDGMNWNNYGEWHIDHKKPVSHFNFKSFNDVEFKKCWSLNNLQPLWAKENQSKGNRYSEES